MLQKCLFRGAKFKSVALFVRLGGKKRKRRNRWFIAFVLRFFRDARGGLVFRGGLSEEKGQEEGGAQEGGKNSHGKFRRCQQSAGECIAKQEEGSAG